MNTHRRGKPWKFSHFRKTHGYANMPLDGVWLRAPYLHNGSVPTLRELLRPGRAARGRSTAATTSTTGRASGFVADGPRLRRTACGSIPRCRQRQRRPRLRAELPDADREALIEYLKTL